MELKMKKKKKHLVEESLSNMADDEYKESKDELAMQKKKKKKNRNGSENVTSNNDGRTLPSDSSREGIGLNLDKTEKDLNKTNKCAFSHGEDYILSDNPQESAEYKGNDSKKRKKKKSKKTVLTEENNLEKTSLPAQTSNDHSQETANVSKGKRKLSIEGICNEKGEPNTAKAKKRSGNDSVLDASQVVNNKTEKIEKHFENNGDKECNFALRETESINSNIQKTRKKKKKKKDRTLDESDSKQQEVEDQMVEETKKKKKKKCASPDDAKTWETADYIPDKKKKRKREVTPDETFHENGNSAENAKKKRKKQKKKNEREDISLDTEIDQSQLDVSDIITSKRKKNKKKKEDCVKDTAHGQEEENITRKKKKHKKGKHDVEVDTQNGESQTLTDQAESQVVSNNAQKYSASLNSGQHAVSLIVNDQSSAEKVVNTGQWQGNLFDSSERQNKFMRLLGGMKKGSSGIGNKLFQPQNGSQKKGLFGSLVAKSQGNTALSTSAAADMNQKLEDEYTKALNIRLSGRKGTGFGFVPDPAEGKKFHIDIHKTKSVQFND